MYFFAYASVLPSQNDIKEFIVDKVYVEDKLNKSAIRKLIAA